MGHVSRGLFQYPARHVLRALHVTSVAGWSPNPARTHSIGFPWFLHLLILSLCGSAGAGGLPFPKNSSFKNALIPICAEDKQTPCAFLKVGSLYRDYQTRGFFRIGLLPVLRAEQVEIVIIDSERFPAVLAGLRPLFLSKGSRQSFEMHQVTFRVKGEAASRLVAPLIRLTEAGDWDLVDGCELWRDDAFRTLPRSRLTVAGPAAGTLHTSCDGGIMTFHLFRSIETKGDPSE